ncbi:unnamed protein product [Adineta ricciae]|uniref:Centrosomal protein of 70 kDa n=1 Tax=Adineta ricciae TaxID=249248 RepID=A0A813XR32_ADIRI|nr:unnamed protein product [Adineta ricciae]CAF1155188.1 unnamed protein product [Adineta ricciae]
MPSNESYQRYHTAAIGQSRRRLPFDSTSTRMSSTSVLKRAIPNTSRYPTSNYHHDIFLAKSSSSSSSSKDDDNDDEVKTLDDTIPENESNIRRNPMLNIRPNRKEIGGPLIQELLQSNMNLKKEIRDIRRQIKHANGSNKQRIERVINNPSCSRQTKIFDDEEDCSFAPPIENDSYDDLLTNKTKLQYYKNEATLYKQQLDQCQETIVHLRKTIHSMEKRIEHLKCSENRQLENASHQHESYPLTSNNNTDHRFIHELFHLCIKYAPKSSKLKTNVPSHQDMKKYIRQTFTDFIRSPSSSSSKISANRNYDNGHFVCKCSDRSQTDHRPTYQYCLNLIEQCQSLFDVTCYTQLSTALNELYYRHGELANFKRSIASTLGITESSRVVSCPKLIKTLQRTLDDAKSNELITFKKMAKINDMNEAISKIRSYDDFVPYYHQFIEQMANLLEVSKGDEIMPAIKTLKLLAHTDSYRPSTTSHSLTRASSLNNHKETFEKPLTQSRSLRVLSSKSNDESNTDSLMKSHTETNERIHDEDSH